MKARIIFDVLPSVDQRDFNYTPEQISDLFHRLRNQLVKLKGEYKCKVDRERAFVEMEVEL